MTAEADRDDDGRQDDVLAAEFVLGLLEPAEHQAFAQRLEREPALAAHVRFWESRFSTLDGDFAETTPPGQAWAGIERRIFAPNPNTAAAATQSWWESLVFWRGAAALAASVAVIAIGLNLVQPRLTPTQFATELVAALQSQEGSGVEFVAFYDTQTGSVRMLGLSGQALTDRDYELWYIRGDEPAVSMGVVPVDQRTEIPLDEQARAKIEEGTVLAVTLEQKGGSPTGVAQGPVVALGRATAI